MGVDQIQLNFTPATLTLMNVLIGFIMFGVALDLKVSDFKQTFKSPKPMLIGLAAHYVVMPAATYLLVLIIQPMPSIALGMFLVAACPSGNLSNFITHVAKGNTALSISISSISTIVAIFLTPLNLMLWANIYPGTRTLLRSFTIDPIDMLLSILLIIGVPLVIGMLVNHKFPNWSQKASKWMKRLSVVIFIVFVLAALAGNFNYFLEYVGLVVIAVFLHNSIALLSGYLSGRAFRLPERDCRSISIEAGIQNSGLGLILIFNFFDGLGGAAIVAAWWGIWHIISGLTLAGFWSRRDPDRKRNHRSIVA